MKINKVIITIFVFLVMLSSAEAYLFRTAAIDGPSYEANGSYVFINLSTIDVGGLTQIGTPAANFNVNSNTVYDVTYSASGYQTDTDDFYFDAGLPTCSGTTCHLTTGQFDTHCTYSPTYDDWTCVVTDTITTQWISFIYNKNDPTWGEVIRILNSMYPGECMPGEINTQQCGETDVGECSYGIQTRTCQSNYYWGSWGLCVGEIGSTAETCDNKDNDCDGTVDEDLTQPTTCGLGECSGNTGTETCTAGVWGGDTCNPLEGAVTEICEGLLDENCDGSVDEGCECTIGNTKSCGSDVGECISGIKTCQADGAWGTECVGEIIPTAEICDGLDNDCDGLIDEGGVCYVPLPDISSMIGMTRFNIINDDYLRPGDSIIILATLENKGDINLEDIRLTFTIPELDMRRRIGPFDLKKNQETTNLIMLDIPYWAEPGYYNIRATASNGNARKVKYREIVIHN